MRASGRPRTRRSHLALAAVAIAVALVCAVAAWRPWGVPSAPVAGADAAPAAPAPLALPDNPHVLVFGDSWVYGSAATVPTLGFAYVISEALGWDAIVDGVRGSGYLKPGIDGPSYGERIAALDPALDPDLVIVEGSINDRRLHPDGYRAAVTAAWDDLAALYPDARIVILGPAPQVLPVERATARIDADLADLATARGWWYISPLAEDWIVAANYLDVIDTTDIGRDHPSTAGHAYLAERLAAALAGLSGVGEVSAEAPLRVESAPQR
ncbi:SGNH/GDSL hydrolase family protein [Microbacterium hominis]|uniref:SGNH/GDSL hydrolase family protein n=1 Tax=Microbacterium hominis TaxID=162426 RepID=A0A7D4PVM5_9MICO|nr:SGNH/GDSL hydrolase family protein [Microbacterium hominis]QKJ19914.1 SGNH/GDSL hydrolase family protein [Microbacterium hominis]